MTLPSLLELPWLSLVFLTLLIVLALVGKIIERRAARLEPKDKDDGDLS